jgi:hypothetical protein
LWPKKLKKKPILSGRETNMDRQKKYAQSEKGKEAQAKARRKYDDADIQRRRQQKREYMQRKRAHDPNYCKWKK